MIVIALCALLCPTHVRMRSRRCYGLYCDSPLFGPGPNAWAQVIRVAGDEAAIVEGREQG